MKPLWTADAASVLVESPVPGFEITTPYGKRPKDRSYWQTRGYHTGDDYADQDGSGHVRGAAAVAVLAGVVEHLEDAVLGHVALLYAELDGEPVTFWYCHLSARTALAGSRVAAGDQLGRVGDTGTGANGPHLHLEKRAGHTRSWSGQDLLPRW